MCFRNFSFVAVDVSRVDHLSSKQSLKRHESYNKHTAQAASTGELGTCAPEVLAHFADSTFLLTLSCH